MNGTARNTRETTRIAKIQAFQHVTGASESTAVAYLTAEEWNLDDALASHNGDATGRMRYTLRVSEIPGKPMTDLQLFAAVTHCNDIVQAAQVITGIVHASVQLRGDTIVMWGASGTHQLNVNVTDAARLHAHWQGFKEQALAAARKQLKA